MLEDCGALERGSVFGVDRIDKTDAQNGIQTVIGKGNRERNFGFFHVHRQCQNGA